MAADFSGAYPRSATFTEDAIAPLGLSRAEVVGATGATASIRANSPSALGTLDWEQQGGSMVLAPHVRGGVCAAGSDNCDAAGGLKEALTAAELRVSIFATDPTRRAAHTPNHSQEVSGRMAPPRDSDPQSATSPRGWIPTPGNELGRGGGWVWWSWWVWGDSGSGDIAGRNLRGIRHAPRLFHSPETAGSTRGRRHFGVIDATRGPTQAEFPATPGDSVGIARIKPTRAPLHSLAR